MDGLRMDYVRAAVMLHCFDTAVVLTGIVVHAAAAQMVTVRFSFLGLSYSPPHLLP
jgi:hypothetical protein